MRDYVRREPDPAGAASANGRRAWGPRQEPDPRRARTASATVFVLVLQHDPELAIDLAAALRANEPCGAGCRLTAVPS